MAAPPVVIEIAEWMRDELVEEGRLYQKVAVRHILAEHGEAHLYRNKKRRWALSKPILDEFQRLTPDNVVWSRKGQLWRLRRPTDPEGSRMVR